MSWQRVEMLPHLPTGLEDGSSSTKRLMKNAFAFSILAMAVALTMAACSANVKATDACKSDAGSANDCRACCHENGASVYKYFSTCECLN